jgi:hypothetical protein
MWQLREISGQTGYRSQNSLNAEFGLGDATVIDSVKIEWTTGRDQILTNVPVNKFLTVVEPIPLVIDEIPPAEIGTDIVVAAADTGNLISTMTLKYRSSGDSTFSSTQMSDLGSGSFQGTIPASVVTKSGVDYQVMVTSHAGRTARMPASGCYSVQIHIPDGISRGEAQPHGSAQTAYRIFSVPLDLDDKSPAALLEDDLGTYDDTRWRFLEYTEGNNFTEYPDIAEIVSGKGYWLIVNEQARTIDAGAGTTNTTSESFAIALHSGWNLIGNPFNFPIPDCNIRFKDGRQAELRTYDGSWNEPFNYPVTSMLPFEGYAVYCDTTESDTLFINHYIPVPTPSLAKRSGTETENEPLWSIQVLARCQEAKDMDNTAGVATPSSPAGAPSDR